MEQFLRQLQTIPEAAELIRRVEEGARIPETTVRTQENLVHLHKRGRMLVASYEAIRLQRPPAGAAGLRGRGGGGSLRPSGGVSLRGRAGGPGPLR